MLLLSAIVISLIGVGIVGAAGAGGGLNGFFGFNQRHVQYNGTAAYNGVYTWNTPYNGIGHNATALVKAKAALAQCKTVYANGASAVASNSFGISVSTSRLDQANANLQSNVTANSTSFDTRISLALFQNAFQQFSLMYRLATHGLNSTQAASLRASLSGNSNTLSACVSSNSIAVTQRGGGFGFGIGIRGTRGFGRR